MRTIFRGGVLRRAELNQVNNCTKSIFSFCHTACAKHQSNFEGSDVEEAYVKAKPFKEIPGPSGLPVIGTLMQYTGPFRQHDVAHYQAVLESRWKQYGSIMKETIGKSTAVRLFDPDDIQTVYKHEGVWPHIVPILESSKKYRESRNMSPGLGNINGEVWSTLRKAIQPVMMRLQDVAEFLPYVNEVADDVIDKIDNMVDNTGSIPHFNNLMARWNLETAARICFDQRLGALDEGTDSHSQRMIQANYDIFDLSTKMMFTLPWKFKANQRLSDRHYEAEDYFYSNGQNLVNTAVSRIKTLAANKDLKEGQFLFISYLLFNTNLSFEDLSITALTLFADGLNATVPTFLLALYCLAKNPQIQEKAFRELQRNVPDKYVTYDCLKKLTYLKACFKESYRFFPLNLDTKRVINHDIVLGGYQVPAGTTIEMCSFVQQMSSKFFDNPTEFQPERWIRGSDHFKMHHPFIVIPFSHGPRMCIGRRIAEQDMYVMMAKLLKTYKVTTSTRDLGLKFQIIQTLDKPVTFSFEKRH
ncbi:probable cytochrome P450 CYP44 [Ylistrum balloti]|uniref:probable cytochrome P450 CYP44 n=1 Tax=Ylistrum balloti TaxID=509963 RepID=UPI002905C34A|nr:probable cytochrome P450 CYP44 [Ylistrum balloti]